MIASAKRRIVYVIGAGFSRSFGYPLASELLPGVWKRLDTEQKAALRKIVKFHFPTFKSTVPSSFPNIEKLLTAIAVNEELFTSSRRGIGNFELAHLANARRDVLTVIEKWFHEIYLAAQVENTWLTAFAARVRQENAAIISFNWDLLLDYAFFGSKLEPASYGFAPLEQPGPVLLKPHGSLNWFETDTLKSNARITLFHDTGARKTYYAFLRFRPPITTHGQTYEPLIIPPTYMKRFDKPIHQEIWNQCTDVLSDAKRIYFLGYSMPDEDRHTQYILHCGLHNQTDGKLRPEGERTTRSGKAAITVVNPNKAAARQIQSVVGPAFRFSWHRQKVEGWAKREGLIRARP